MWIWTSWSVRGVKTFISASDGSEWVWMYESEMEGCDWDYLSPASANTWLPLAHSSRSDLGYFWDLVPSVAAEEWSQWLMRWKLAPQLQPSLVIPFSWSWDEIIAGRMSTLISMTQPGPAYTALCSLDIIGRLLSIVPGLFGAGSMQYLFQPWPGQSDKTSGKEFSHEWVWDQRSGSDSSRWRGQG